MSLTPNEDASLSKVLSKLFSKNEVTSLYKAASLNNVFLLMRLPRCSVTAFVLEWGEVLRNHFSSIKKSFSQ